MTLFQRDRTWHPPALAPDYKTSVARSPRQAMLSLEATPSELSGPRFGHSDIVPGDNDLITNYAKGGDPVGERIIVHGRVLDENRRPVPHTLVEIWHDRHEHDADAAFQRPTYVQLLQRQPDFRAQTGRTHHGGKNHQSQRHHDRLIDADKDRTKGMGQPDALENLRR